MPRLSFGKKLLISFILVLLPVLGLDIYSYRVAYDRRIDSVLTREMQTAQAVSIAVDDSIDEALTLLWSLASDPSVHSLSPSQLDPRFQQLATFYPQYETIVVFDAGGNDKGSSVPYPPDAQRVQVADRPYFQQVMTTGKPVISEVLISRRTFRPTIPVAVPLRDEEGKTVGAVVLGIYLDALSDKLKNITLGPGQSVLLADQTGTIAFHTALPEIPFEQRDLSSFEPVRAALDGRPITVKHFVSPLLGDTRIGAFTPTARYGWVVGVTVLEDIALAPVRTELINQLIGLSAIAVFTVGIVLILSSVLLRPVQRLTEVAQALGRGDLAQRADIRTGDQLEELGKTFNQMAGSLAKSLGDLRAVIDATESGIIMYDPNFVIRMVNQPVARWFQLDSVKVVGQPVDKVAREFIAPKLAEPERLLARLDWLRERPEEAIWEEIEQVRPEYRVFRLYIGSVRADHTQVGYIDVYTDITEIRRQGEERAALGEVAAVLVRERMLEGVAEVVVEQGRRVFKANTVGLFLLDLERGELRLLAYRGLSPESVAELTAFPITANLLTALAARTGQPQEVPDVEALGPELAGARRIAEREGQQSIFSHPLYVRGRMVGMLTIAKPVPHQLTQWERDFVRAFADLITVAVENARLYEELGETLRLRNEFLEVAAHELKTPVTTLLGYAQLLSRTQVSRPPEERQALAAVERQAKRITRLAEDLSETISPSYRPLQRQVFDLTDLAEQVVQEAAELSKRHQPMLCRPGPVTVKADPDQVRRILITLLDNAIRFSPRGGRIEVTVAAQESMAFVSVHDYGFGIPKERQRHVFEPFYEPHPAGTLGYSGATGLGLYVARTLVERQGGKISLTSEEGKGATFFFTLPLAQVGE